MVDTSHTLAHLAGSATVAPRPQRALEHLAADAPRVEAQIAAQIDSLLPADCKAIMRRCARLRARVLQEARAGDALAAMTLARRVAALAATAALPPGLRLLDDARQLACDAYVSYKSERWGAALAHLHAGANADRLAARDYALIEAELHRLHLVHNMVTVLHEAGRHALALGLATGLVEHLVASQKVSVPPGGHNADSARRAQWFDALALLTDEACLSLDQLHRLRRRESPP